MEKNFKNIASLYLNAEKVAYIAAQISQSVEKAEDCRVSEDPLSDICFRLTNISDTQKQALRKKFFVKFNPTAQELMELAKCYPRAAPQVRSVANISVPELCEWLDANPEMLLPSQREYFLALDYDVFGELCFSLELLKTQIKRLVELRISRKLSIFENMYTPFRQPKFEAWHKMDSEDEQWLYWESVLHECALSEEKMLSVRFSDNFPRTTEQGYQNPNFSLVRFCKLLRENPRLLSENKEAFLDFSRNTENNAAVNEVLKVFKESIFS